jgi:hypothetical protein
VRRVGASKGGTRRLTRSKLPRLNCVLNLVRQPLDLLDVLRILPLRLRSGVQLIVHRHSTVKEVVELSLLDDETFLDTLLSSPILSMGLPLDEDLEPKEAKKISSQDDGSEDETRRARRTCLVSIPPYHLIRIASAPSVFSSRPR